MDINVILFNVYKRFFILSRFFTFFYVLLFVNERFLHLWNKLHRVAKN